MKVSVFASNRAMNGRTIFGDPHRPIGIYFEASREDAHILGVRWNPIQYFQCRPIHLANLILGLLRKPDVAVGIRLDSVRLITNISKLVSTTGATTWLEFAAA